MRCRRLLLIVTVLVATAAPGWAGIIFNRKPKPQLTERVAQLIVQLKTDQDDRRRAAAAEELRNFDGAAYPEIVNALVEAAMGDAKPNVRAEAVQSLGRIRPISQRAGWALEQIVASDSAVRVQVQARSALLAYRMSGYRSSKDGEPPIEGKSLKTEEPPLAEPLIGAVPSERSVNLTRRPRRRRRRVKPGRRPRPSRTGVGLRCSWGKRRRGNSRKSRDSATHLRA